MINYVVVVPLRYLILYWYFWIGVAVLAAFGIGIADSIQYHTDRVGWYLDHPEARDRDHFVVPEKELVKRFGPRTEVTADGRTCMTGRCPGGYATWDDYHKANDAKNAEFAAEYERQRQARYNALHANDQ